MGTTLREIVLGSVWGKALTEAELARVLGDTRERDFPAGGYVCREGDAVDHWVGVIEGLLKLSRVSESGKLTTFAGVSTGTWFSEGSLLKTERRRYDAIALRDSRVALMPRATFNWLLDSNFAFNRFLLQQFNERLSYFIAMVGHERMLEPDARVARCLASMYNPHFNLATSDRLRISQEEIAYLSGFSRQRVNQALGVLESAGLLKVDYGEVRILDLQGLRDFLG